MDFHFFEFLFDLLMCELSRGLFRLLWHASGAVAFDQLRWLVSSTFTGLYCVVVVSDNLWRILAPFLLCEFFSFIIGVSTKPTHKLLNCCLLLPILEFYVC